MVNYICPRCHYKTTDKSRYRSHLKRKIICNNKYLDDDLQGEYIKYNITENIKKFKSINISSKKLQKIPKKKNNILKKSSKNTHKSSNIKNKCEFCEKELSSYKNLWRHLKICKEKIKQEEADKSVKELVNLLNQQIETQREEFKKEKEQLRKEIEEKNKQITELIKKAGFNNSGTITQNIQNNIKLLAYQDTDLSKITDLHIKRCLNHNNMCVPHLIKMIHLDPDKPENHNVYISNLKNGYIMLYDGNKWNAQNREDVIDNMIDEKQLIIEEKIEDWVQKGKQYPNLMKKFERYINKKDKNEVLNKIKEEIKLMLYNSREIVHNEI